MKLIPASRGCIVEGWAELVIQVVARYFMGYWPAKVTSFLNIVLMVGYTVLSAIIAGQMLSAVTGGSMSIVVGIVIITIITWFVSVFGMRLFHLYER